LATTAFVTSIVMFESSFDATSLNAIVTLLPLTTELAALTSTAETYSVLITVRPASAPARAETALLISSAEADAFAATRCALARAAG
jgi:hypothetical protein